MNKEAKAMYKYFCGACGKRFESELPEKDKHGLLNDIFCPECGSYEIYTDDEEGRRMSVKVLNEYESDLIANED